MPDLPPQKPLTVPMRPAFFHAPEGFIDKAFYAPLLDRVLDLSLPFVFHYQPIVDLRHATVVGYEALVRFPLEIGLAPDRCFEVAEHCGRRLDLEELLLRRALQDRAHLPPNCFLTINLSPTFMLTRRWDELLAEAKSLDGVVVEITEQDLIKDYDGIRIKIEAIRELRGSVAVDDTGSGYASLKHVMELRPNFVKLDRFFVGGCNLERSKSTLIEMMGTATNRLDAWIVAEGVETAAELDELIRLDVPLAQGFFLGRPEPLMVPLSASVATRIRSRATALAQADTVIGHTEDCHLCNTVHEAQVALRTSPETSLAMVVDEWKRPVELLEMHPVIGLRTVDRLMRVQGATHPAEVLHRALTRDTAHHFDPIASIDDTGQLLGVLRIDRLMRVLLETKRT